MSEADPFSGAKVIISIKATHQIRDDTGFNILEETKGELVLTEKEFIFLEVKGTFKKEKIRKHGFPSNRLIGQSYEHWSGGPTTMYLTYEDDKGNSKYFVYGVRKGDYDKFIGKVHELRLI